MFKGSLVALITPMKDGKIDEDALQKFVEWQIAQGTDGLVPCGTTGESPTLSHQEHMRVSEMTIEIAAGRVPVIAGAGSNSTAEAISLSRHAQKAGADAVLVVTPYYNKPSQEGLYRHYKEIHDSVDIPLIIYNIPGRSVVNMSVDTMARLAELDHVVGVKDATADLSRPLAERVVIRGEFCQLSGEDATALPYLAAGGSGCISVTANIAPKACADMQRAWREGNVKDAMALQEKLMPVHQAMFCEVSPGPVKYAAKLLGICSDEMRLPLCEIAPESKARVEAALKGAQLL